MQSVPDDIAHNQHGRVLRPFGDEIEVTAHALSGGDERRRELETRALGQFERGQRVADRAQVLELVLGHVKAGAEVQQLGVAHARVAPQTPDQDVLVVLPSREVIVVRAACHLS